MEMNPIFNLKTEIKIKLVQIKLKSKTKLLISHKKNFVTNQTWFDEPFETKDFFKFLAYRHHSVIPSTVTTWLYFTLKHEIVQMLSCINNNICMSSCMEKSFNA